MFRGNKENLDPFSLRQFFAVQGLEVSVPPHDIVIAVIAVMAVMAVMAQLRLSSAEGPEKCWVILAGRETADVTPRAEVVLQKVQARGAVRIRDRQHPPPT